MLTPGETDFNELTIRVNPRALQWCAAAGLLEGTRDLAGHIQLSSPQKHSKLALMMHLVVHGWAARRPGCAGDYYACGLGKSFELAPSRSKLYFAVFAVVDKVLAKLAVDDAVLPLVYHGMPESYYKLLLRMGGPRDAKELLSLLEGAPNPKMLSDQQFAQLLPAVEAVGNMQDADGLPQNLPAMLDMPWDAAAVQEDVARVHRSHRMAAQVLRAIPADMIDFVAPWRAVMEAFPSKLISVTVVTARGSNPDMWLALSRGIRHALSIQP